MGVKLQLGSGLVLMPSTALAERLPLDSFWQANGGNDLVALAAVIALGLLSLSLICALLLFRRRSQRAKVHSLLGEIGWGMVPLILLWALLLPVLGEYKRQEPEQPASPLPHMSSNDASGAR